MYFTVFMTVFTLCLQNAGQSRKSLTLKSFNLLFRSERFINRIKRGFTAKKVATHQKRRISIPKQKIQRAIF